MILFEATYFDGRQSKPYRVTVAVKDQGIHIRGNNGVPDLLVPAAKCTVTPPLGKNRRSLLLPGGARCDSDDLAAVAALDRHMGRNRGMGFVHRLESHWKTSGACLAGLVGILWLFTAYGIPFLATKAADSVPAEVAEELSRKTLETLERRWLQPSELEPARMAELRAVFSRLRTRVGSDADYRLEFRKSAQMGPNAFALPSGQVVITDELVRLAQNDEELTGIFLHEMTHIRKRHGMRMLFQNTGVFLLVSAVAGDLASVASIAGALPTLLVETGYSRKFEKEADLAAGAYFIEKGGTTEPYRNILRRMARRQPEDATVPVLSSHPLSEKRIQYLLELDRAQS
jgi:Zn-dependent protease with chaperone function